MTCTQWKDIPLEQVHAFTMDKAMQILWTTLCWSGSVVPCEREKPEALRIRGVTAYAARILGRGLTGMLMARIHGRCGLPFGHLADLPITD